MRYMMIPKHARGVPITGTPVPPPLGIIQAPRPPDTPVIVVEPVPIPPPITSPPSSAAVTLVADMPVPVPPVNIPVVPAATDLKPEVKPTFSMVPNAKDGGKPALLIPEKGQSVEAFRLEYSLNDAAWTEWQNAQGSHVRATYPDNFSGTGW